MKSNAALKIGQASTAEADRAVAALAALAQETRLAIFRLLVEYAPTGLTPGAIALRLKLAPATLSFHLKELASAGLITDRRDGRFIWYRADLRAMNGLLGYLTEHCCRGTGGADCEPGCAPACGPSSKRTRNKP
jgi:DNA-binding transcriptional ArsR family regulator